jgi:serine/threonine-protein kinase
VEGTPFGRYRLIELLGRGGMGEVWRAYDTDTDRIVAIKLLPAYFSDNEEFQRRFRREAHAAARLNTPHVVPIHNYGEIDGRLYVDMRLIEGRDLQEVLADGPMEPGRAVRVIEGIALALHAAHEVGLLHRDVKPSNVLLDENDFAYLIDFGIARALDESRLTSTGVGPGTVLYIAPERLGEHPDEDDARVDIYALACVLYECLTGRPPFSGSPASIIAAHLNTPPPQPSSTQQNVSGQFDEVIATGMAKDPDNRYSTTVELADAARDAITVPIQRPTPSPAPNPPTQQAPATAPTLPGQPVPPTLLNDHVAPTPMPASEAVRQQPADLHNAPTQQRPPGWAPVPQIRPPDRPPPEIGRSPRKPWWQRQPRPVKLAIIGALVAVLAAAGLTGYLLWPNPSRQTVPPVLPFTGLNHPVGVAVDVAGNVYVADSYNNRVVKLATGSSTQAVLPFTVLNNPSGVAVDTGGSVYVADFANNRVVKLAAGSSTQTELPFTGLYGPNGVAVDTGGSVYVADYNNHRVLKLAAGSNTQTELPFTGLYGPNGVAVDTGGSVYVADYNNHQVLKLPAGTNTQTELPFTGLNNPSDVAVDTAGNVYLADPGNGRVLKLAAGSNTQSVLPFTGLSAPSGVAVDTAGNVYAADSYNNRVMTLSAG